MALHAFVAMPFGLKEGIDFNRVYRELIKPALEAAGFDVFRADEEMRAGEIRNEMFQELLLADLVVVDLSIDNPNVWYELGVRHGLRKRGVVQIGSRNDRLPFDVVTDRTLHYDLRDGAPNPDTLEEDKRRLAVFATETMKAWHGWKVSPVYQLLPALEEPNWRKLAVAESHEFWDIYKQWSSRVEIARRNNRAGDILVLTEETPTWVLRLEARRLAGQALTKLGELSLALEQYESALEIDPTDLVSRQQRGLLLGRLGKHAEARQQIKDLIDQHPTDPETWSLLGRVEKNEWMARWREPGASPETMRRRASEELALLAEAIEPYRAAFTADPSHYYSGVNALALLQLQVHLGGDLEDPALLSELSGGVGWSCQAAVKRQPKDYWARASAAEFHLLSSEPTQAVKAYKSAIAVADRDWFKLDSSRQQLLLLRDLEFRPDVVDGTLKLVNAEYDRAVTPGRPGQVFLFSGHMIDQPGRADPRFPADKEPIAARAIADKLLELGAGANDLGICGGACGGDTLFAEACLARGMPVHLYLQFEEAAFLKASVSFAGVKWVERYDALKRHPRCQVRVQTAELGPPPKGVNPYVRNNLWQLYTALSHGPERVRFLSLWDGKAGDGPGGTKHLIEAVERYFGRAYVLRTTDLW